LSPVVVMRASNSSGGRDPSSDVIASRIACETSGDGAPPHDTLLGSRPWFQVRFGVHRRYTGGRVATVP
jgi:hypothetical protein